MFTTGSAGGSIHIDGIPTLTQDLPQALLLQRCYDLERRRVHPNEVTRLHTITVVSPHLQRTVGAMETAGVTLSRIADPSPFSPELSMAFFKMSSPAGSVLIEVVSPSQPGSTVKLPGLPSIGGDIEAPAQIGGLVFQAPSLDNLPTLLGPDNIGKARPAVQGKGRMIAPLRHDRLGIPLTTAIITPPQTS